MQQAPPEDQSQGGADPATIGLVVYFLAVILIVAALLFASALF